LTDLRKVGKNYFISIKFNTSAREMAKTEKVARNCQGISNKKDEEAKYEEGRAAKKYIHIYLIHPTPIPFTY